MRNYKVRQGDSLSSIAKRYRLEWKTIYNHTANTSFRNKYPDPNKIGVGDKLFIPGRAEVHLAMYYVVQDEAFKRAAQTWSNELSGTCYFAPFSCESDFKNAWNQWASWSCVENYWFRAVQIFSHATKGTGEQTGLEFRPCAGDQEDGTLNRQEIQSLPLINWHPSGKLILSGCNTGLTNGGWAPAQVLAQYQGIYTCGQTGYGYFSRNAQRYEEIDRKTSTVYLWAYRRGKNGALGNGRRMQERWFTPAPRYIEE